MQAGSRSAKASKPMQAVINHAHVESGMRESVMPFVRKSRVVAMKFSEPSNCPIQKSAIETAQRFWPIASPGPASFPTELNVA